jgi:Fe2+ transport system protein FeoA
MKRDSIKTEPDAQCVQSGLCPLSQVRVGSVVCIKQLIAPEELSGRLREMGLREEQEIKLLSSENNLICLVCNARLGISAQLAEAIMVEPRPDRQKVA